MKVITKFPHSYFKYITTGYGRNRNPSRIKGMCGIFASISRLFDNPLHATLSFILGSLSFLSQHSRNAERLGFKSVWIETIAPNNSI